MTVFNDYFIHQNSFIEELKEEKNPLRKEALNYAIVNPLEGWGIRFTCHYHINYSFANKTIALLVMLMATQPTGMNN